MERRGTAVSELPRPVQLSCRGSVVEPNSLGDFISDSAPIWSCLLTAEKLRDDFLLTFRIKKVDLSSLLLINLTAAVIHGCDL